MDIQLFVACKAFITYQDKLLLLRESNKYQDGTNIGNFDVPGGRLQPGESWREGLLREVHEETELAVEIGQPFMVNEWRPVVRGEQWQIVGIFFECIASSKDVVLSSDHDAFEWILPEEYKKYNIIENMKPVFEKYSTLVKK